MLMYNWRKAHTSLCVRKNKQTIGKIASNVRVLKKVSACYGMDKRTTEIRFRGVEKRM